MRNKIIGCSDFAVAYRVAFPSNFNRHFLEQLKALYLCASGYIKISLVLPCHSKELHLPATQIIIPTKSVSALVI